MKVHTGYVASIAGGMILGFLLGGMAVASAMFVPLIYVFLGGVVGAIIGGRSLIVCARGSVLWVGRAGN